MTEHSEQSAFRPDRAVSWAGRIGAGVFNAATVLARWAEGQSWWRIFLFAMLLLIAQGIVGDMFFGKHGEVTHVVTTTKGKNPVVIGAPGIDIHDDDSGDHVHIGMDGIRVTTQEGKGAASGKPEAPAKPEVPAPGKHATPVTPAPGPEPEPLPSPDADKADQNVVIDVTGRSSEVARNLLEGCVMLLIVYAIGAKLLRRRTAQTEARAVHAEALAEREVLERQLAQARLQALQAQVEPHFLFNTLASVDFLIESDPARASRMQKHLIQYLRSALPQMRSSQSNLGREFDLSRAYLEILQMRMEDRLSLEFAVPDGLRSAEFPPMMLQSLVENAIAHGLEPSAQGGQLRLAATVVDGRLLVEVADSGIGLRAAAGQSKGSGVGLSNIRERLRALYGDEGYFDLRERDPQGALAVIRIPYRVARVDA